MKLRGRVSTAMAIALTASLSPAGGGEAVRMEAVPLARTQATESGTLYVQTSSRTTNAKVLITNPAKGSKVGWKIYPAGTVTPTLPTGYELWVVLQDGTFLNHFPQAGPAVVAGTKWTSGAAFVDSPQVASPQPWYVVVVTANETAQGWFRQYMAGAPKPGVGTLPAGATVAARVAVVRV